MKDTKGVIVDRDIKYVYLESPHKKDSIGASDLNDFGCQFNSIKDNLICTCKKVRRREAGYFSSRQVFRSQRCFDTGDLSDIRAGGVKTVYRRRVRRILLPETEDKGVGPSELSNLRRRKRWLNDYYELKKTSSKCIGGVMEEIKASVISKKLSPMLQTICVSTSPTNIYVEKNDNSSSFDNKQTADKENSILIPDTPTLVLKTNNDPKPPLSKGNKTTSTIVCTNDDSKNFSSDSFEQHVHNLENPSYDKQSKTSLVIENKLEREYRKIFSTNSKTPDKPITDRKSSILKRRFMALTRLGKKEDRNNSTIMKISSKSSIISKRDVSIASDPPSLEARSYSNTKMYTSSQSDINAYEKNAPKPKTNDKWSTENVNSDCRDVKDMFKLWGKKFNLEESNKEPLPDDSNTTAKKQKKKVELVLPKKEELRKEKKEGKRFSFFRRKSKDKSKPFKSKKGITAGRCEVGDGLMIKIGAPNEYNTYEPTKTFDSVPNCDVLRKAWFRRYLHDRIDSQNSVQIRWNNNMYGTSSSTVFELIDCIYKNTGFVFKSRSHVTTRESSHYSYRNPQVNFLQQSVQAWMIPTISGDQLKSTNKKTIEVTISNQRWLVEKSKAFSRKFELILHTNVQNTAVSSEYILIDIPDGYFSESSDDKRDQTSDELVYNVIEYDMPNSKSNLQNNIQGRRMETGDVKDEEIPVNIKYDKNISCNVFEKVIKGPCLQRDVVIQGSDVWFPRRCDVIGVGIITQRDLRKPILKTNNEPTDVESSTCLPPPRTCELAESFLQEYYKNCSPLGLDIFSWCVSDSKLRGSSASNSLNSFNNQGDGSKSCPNMYEDYLTHSTIVSSCDTSSCSHCIAIEQEKKEDKKASNFFNRFKKACESTTERKRVLPKDSLEVFKRRRFYAQTNNKSRWFDSDYAKLVNVPSFQDKCAQQPLGDCAKVDERNVNDSRPNTAKCKKHVSLQDCDVLHDLLKEQLSEKAVEGILSFKGAACDECKTTPSPRRARVIPDPLCEIPKPPCEETCLNEKKPACSKKNSPTCNVPKPPSCPADPKIPCQKACPPLPPPCLTPPCAKTSSFSLSKVPSPSVPRKRTTTCSKSSSPRSTSSRVKVVPPRIHSPPISPNPSRPCACPVKKMSVPSIPNCPICKSPLQSTAPSCPPPRKANLTCKSCNSPCDSPPSKVEKVSSHQFPWPLKSQTSNTPSRESGLHCKMASEQNLLKKTSSKCMNAIKKIIKKYSGSSLKDCRPDCANRRKLESPPAPPPSLKSDKCRPKVTGLHLKKPPMPKTCSKDCLTTVDDGVIRLNSREKITVKLRQGSPSTDEIREGLNVKVQDEDGRTLYERKDYRKKDQGRMQFVKDMYRESQIQRLVTTNPDILQQETNKESTSDMNLSNIIEINFNLKFNQDDKSTEMNIQDCNKSPAEEQEQQLCTHQEHSKEIFMLNDQQKQSNDANKNDRKAVNISIIIKNYKVPNKETSKRNENLITDEFSKKISEKFQSVSTGYSEIIDHPTYSVHRATIDLSNTEIKKASSKISEPVNNRVTEPESLKLTESEKTVNLTVSNKTSSNFDELLITKTESQIKLSKDDIYTTNDEKSATSLSATGNDTQSEVKEIHKSDVIHKVRDKEEKKKMLKEIFESPSNDKNKNKERLRQMLHAVLTSDSSDFDVDISNQLAGGLTSGSFKNKYYKTSGSFTNYINDTISVQSVVRDVKKIYTTEEENSDSSSSVKIDKTGCLCNKMAEKLRICDKTRVCCCGKVNKVEKGVDCDLIDNNNNTINEVNVQTQNVEDSKRLLYYEDIEKIQETKSKQYSSNVNVKACQIKKISKRTILSLSDDDQIVLLSSQNCRTSNTIEPLDILQLHETKKAVLGIYAERRLTKEGAKIVSKLPKFMFERESDIQNYQEVIAGYKR